MAYGKGAGSTLQCKKTPREILTEAKARNAQVLRLINRGEMNYYVTYTGKELCSVNKLLIDVLESVLTIGDSDLSSGTTLVKDPDRELEKVDSL